MWPGCAIGSRTESIYHAVAYCAHNAISNVQLHKIKGRSAFVPGSDDSTPLFIGYNTSLSLRLHLSGALETLFDIASSSDL